jgi:hypothetical protein
MLTSHPFYSKLVDELSEPLTREWPNRVFLPETPEIFTPSQLTLAKTTNRHLCVRYLSVLKDYDVVREEQAYVYNRPEDRFSEMPDELAHEWMDWLAAHLAEFDLLERVTRTHW